MGTVDRERLLRFGSPAWIRTTIHGSKGRCPTIRRPGNFECEYPSVLVSSHFPQIACRPLQYFRKAIWTGVWGGLQNRSAAVEAAGVFDSHCLPPFNALRINELRWCSGPRTRLRTRISRLEVPNALSSANPLLKVRRSVYL